MFLHRVLRLPCLSGANHPISLAIGNWDESLVRLPVAVGDTTWTYLFTKKKLVRVAKNPQQGLRSWDRSHSPSASSHQTPGPFTASPPIRPIRAAAGHHTLTKSSLAMGFWEVSLKKTCARKFNSDPGPRGTRGGTNLLPDFFDPPLFGIGWNRYIKLYQLTLNQKIVGLPYFQTTSVWPYDQNLWIHRSSGALHKMNKVKQLS